MLTKINDISSYFVKKGLQWVFVGKKLEVWIPKLYEDRGLLTLGETALSLGIFQLRINDVYYANTMMLARIGIEFVSTRKETEEGYPYIVLTLEKDSVFMISSNVVKNTNVIYEVFVAFIALGAIPPFVTYDDIQQLFDRDQSDCGVNLKVNHSIYEIIFAHMYRDKKDPYTFYRNTDMANPPVIVNTHQISHSPQSTTARVVGSYLAEGMTASLVDDTERISSKVENILRA